VPKRVAKRGDLNIFQDQMPYLGQVDGAVFLLLFPFAPEQGEGLLYYYQQHPHPEPVEEAAIQTNEFLH
jgi:hypothetical protein